ncbi:hypothetical protein Taro_033838 [Colocasia esculenta]|uniref:Uncharacterized protein n=1 Tax=Colocasia esculenta TaxID=4460 RepID=A0A843VW88_COLES|nr:hypothetical protein [Colocasia esculenta]
MGDLAVGEEVRFYLNTCTADVPACMKPGGTIKTPLLHIVQTFPPLATTVVILIGTAELLLWELWRLLVVVAATALPGVGPDNSNCPVVAVLISMIKRRRIRSFCSLPVKRLSTDSPNLSTGACFPELQVAGLYTSIDKSLIAVDRSIQTSKLKFCLQPSVDRPFLAVDMYNPELNFCTLSCLNPCQNFILKAMEVILSFTLDVVI